MSDQLDIKFNKLNEIIKSYSKICVAFSGGVDSTLLLKVSADALGTKNVLAVTAVSETYTETELITARRSVSEYGVKHITLRTAEIKNPDFRDNSSERCYYCKTSFFKEALPIAHSHGFAFICDGSNTDDLHDYRPGRRAAEEHGIRSPLIDADISKPEVRQLSQKLGIPGYDRPANPCLASRIPYGTEITVERLRAVEEAEKFLKSSGFPTVRVRHHGEVARIEILPDDFSVLMAGNIRDDIYEKFRSLGFTWVSLDIAGYRMGSMNEVLN